MNFDLLLKEAIAAFNEDNVSFLTLVLGTLWAQLLWSDSTCYARLMLESYNQSL